MSNFRYQTQADVSASELMDVLLDFDAYTRILSAVDRIQVVKQGPPVWEVLFGIEVIRKFQYTLRLEQRGQYELHWSLVSGFFIKNDGSWSIQPIEQGVQIVYDVEMEMDTYLPASIRNSLARHKLPKMVERFIQETKARRALKGIDLGDN